MTALTAPAKRRISLDPTVIVYLALIAVVIIGAILVAANGANFFSQGNLRFILTAMSVVGLVAIGQTLVILCGSLDLSVPMVITVAAIGGVTVMNGNEAMVIPGVLTAVAIGAAIGLANGLLVTGLKVNGFIATLGTGLIVKGFIDANFRGPVGGATTGFQSIGNTYFGPLPLSTLLLLLLAAVIFVMLRYTRLGARIYAVGGDAGVARLSGVRTQPPVIIAHVLCSIFAALAGLLLAARSGSVSPTAGVEGGYDLLSIAAVVLGGTLLMGGRGSVWGTIGGVGIFAVLSGVTSVLGGNDYTQSIVRGVVIVLAVVLYAGRVAHDRRVRFGRKEAS